MDEAIARLNIEHFRKQLAVETDEEKRRILRRLLTEEETKLERLKMFPQEARKKG